MIHRKINKFIIRYMKHNLVFFLSLQDINTTPLKEKNNLLTSLYIACMYKDKVSLYLQNVKIYAA